MATGLTLAQYFFSLFCKLMEMEISDISALLATKFYFILFFVCPFEYNDYVNYILLARSKATIQTRTLLR